MNPHLTGILHCIYCTVLLLLYIAHKNIIIMLWCCYHYWAVLCVTDVSLVGLCVKKIIIHSVTVVIICYILSEFLHTCSSVPILSSKPTRNSWASCCCPGIQLGSIAMQCIIIVIHRVSGIRREPFLVSISFSLVGWTRIQTVQQHAVSDTIFYWIDMKHINE